MIRKMEKSDINRVMQIWQDTNVKAHNFIPETYWRNKYNEVEELLLQSELYVFEDGISHEIQGFIGLIDSYIGGIFVCDQSQCKGIGKQLLDYAKKVKISLSLSVYQKNVKAIEFYKRENFKIKSEGIDKDTNQREYFMVWES
ncbi:GNAT family N-acetyltransferase [Kineothrix sp. MB12-C1]|uniref:GNAT family N-acetyltransferase n=1 Tax=Kineothrix sp. MB12-C1 TaxID=3070215 RepID=UPI0027D2F4A7|nr:GNAT family N-acetyltransferase [Kineothrix sp. MB12-C1]WMC92593.1 GNAT family N-acetyltransferase [Kineothrix sp. MB12-C1]